MAAGMDANATYNFVAPSTTGSHVVVIRYPGDAQHMPSSGAFAVLVGNVVPSGSFTLSASSLSIANNSTGATAVTITPAGAYSGALTWSASYTGATAATICYFVDTPPINGPTNATLHLGVGTACMSPSALKVPSSVQRSSAGDFPHPPTRRAPVAAVFALILFVLLPSRRRTGLPLLACMCIAILPLTVSGCGGGSSSAGGGGAGGGGAGGGGAGGNPQPQVYTITLTGRDSVNSSITSSTSFTLTVN